MREGDVATGDDAAARIARHVGRPQVTDAIRARVQALVLEDPERPPGEICRLLKDDGTPLGLSTVYRVLASVRSTIPASLLVRFEGVAGEYAQFDFGVVSVRLTDGSRRTVHFAAYRLKYSLDACGAGAKRAGRGPDPKLARQLRGKRRSAASRRIR